MDIYADELFAVNFIACYFMIKIYSLIINKTLENKRGIAAAAAGGAAACIRFMYEALAPVCIAAEILLPVIAFGKVSRKQILLFFLIKYAFSGLAIPIVSCFGGASAVIRNGIIYFNISTWIFIPVFVLCIILSLFTAKLMKIKRSRFYTISVIGRSGRVRLKALYDSGNMLRNPYDKSGVMIVNKETAEKIGYERTYLIPFTALGSENGLLRAFKAAGIYCVENGKNINNITVGISEHLLSKNKEIEALIGPEIFKEEV